jgi:hypothetical protein
VAALVAPPPLPAHDLWIAPSSFTPTVGEPLRLHLVLGGGEEVERVPRADAGIVRFVAVGPEGGAQPVPGLDGLDPAGFLRPAIPGWYTILYESSPSFTTLAPETFRAYLLEKGLRPARGPASSAKAEEPTTELFRRSLKARIHVASPGDAEPSDPGGEEPAGLPFELVLEHANAPAQPEAGHDVVLRLLLDGAPLAGSLVEVRRLDQQGSGPSARTDIGGRLRLTLGPGSWLATAVHLDAARPATADWESVWTSLTFELR